MDGTPGTYRILMLEEYGENNPDLNKIAAYYANRFHDQDTLNWLKLQHPAKRPHLDVNALAMMVLFPEGEAAEESLQGQSAEEESEFEQASAIEKSQDPDSLADGEGKNAKDTTSALTQRGARYILPADRSAGNAFVKRALADFKSSGGKIQQLDDPQTFLGVTTRKKMSLSLRQVPSWTR